MHIAIEREGVKFEIVGPDREGESPYFMKVIDSVHHLVLFSMINESTQEGFKEAFDDKRNFLKEYRAIHAIRTANARVYGHGKPIEEKVFFRRLSFEANRFTVTPFSSFVISSEDGTPIGRLGIGQGYGKEDINLSAVREKAAECGFEPEDVYVPSENETQLAVLLSPQMYSTNYTPCVILGIKVAELMIALKFIKPINYGTDTYFTRKRIPADRWTFTVVDTRRLVAGQAYSLEIELAEEKQSQFEELERQGIVRKYGYLLPKAVDRRNYNDLPRLVFGRP